MDVHGVLQKAFVKVIPFKLDCFSLHSPFQYNQIKQTQKVANHVETISMPKFVNHFLDVHGVQLTRNVLTTQSHVQHANRKHKFEHFSFHSMILPKHNNLQQSCSNTNGVCTWCSLLDFCSNSSLSCLSCTSIASSSVCSRFPECVWNSRCSWVKEEEESKVCSFLEFFFFMFIMIMVTE